VALSMGHLTTRLREREAALERHHQEREQLLAEKHRAELLAEARIDRKHIADAARHLVRARALR